MNDSKRTGANTERTGTSPQIFSDPTRVDDTTGSPKLVIFVNEPRSNGRLAEVEFLLRIMWADNDTTAATFIADIPRRGIGGHFQERSSAQNRILPFDISAT